MLELPVWTHQSWRPLFEQSWRRARPLLVFSCGIAPGVVAVAGLAILAGYGILGGAAALVAIVLTMLFAPAAYLWWFLLTGRVAKRGDFWGTRVALGAATSWTLSEPAVALQLPTRYIGRIRMDATSLTWSLRAFRRTMPGMTFDDGVALNEILDAKIARVPDPMQVPPLGYTGGGDLVRPRRGELLVVRTPQREVGVPAKQPRRLYELLNMRCSTIRSSPTSAL